VTVRARRLGLALCLFVAAPAMLRAQTTAGVHGRVTAAAGGAPLSAARVDLAPGDRHAETGTDGTYAFHGLAPGVYRLTVRAVGYTPLIADSVTLVAGRTARIDFALQTTTVRMPGIVVRGAADQRLNPRIVATTQRITRDELRELPLTTLQEAVALTAGVVGASYRGGRPGEDAMIVDGMAVKNQFDASTGSLGIAIPVAALEHADVITNGFSAQYGQALSGMITVRTRDGGDRLAGGVTYETDRPMGVGADFGLDRVVATVGGPLLGRVRFLTIVDAQARRDDTPLNAPPPTDSLDPRSTTPSLLPHAAGERYDVFAKLTAPVGALDTVRITGVASFHQQLLFDPVLKYALDRAAAQAIGGHLALAQFRHRSRADSNWATLLDIRLGYYDKEAIRAPLLTQPTTRFGAFTFSGFDFVGKDVARAMDSAAAVDSIPGFIAPEPSSDTPWGVPAFFMTGSPRGELRWNRFREARARVDLTVGRGPTTVIRTGGEYVRQHAQTFTRLLAYAPEADSGVAPVLADFSPFAAAAYAELTQRVSDLTFVLGIRVDAFSARADTGTAALGGTKVSVGPRFGVSTSLDNAVVTASYGRYAQAPDFQYLVDAAFDDTLRTGRARRGNPDLGFETSTQYELHFRYRTSPSTLLSAGAYVKHIDGLVASVPVGFNPDSAIFANADYGDVRGIELTLEREFNGFIGTRVTYTLQSATATATSPLDFFRHLSIDSLGDTVFPGNVTIPLDYDRRHAIIGIVRAHTPDEAGPWLGGLQAALVGRWGSGLPFSRTDFTGDTLKGFPNAERLPPEWTIDGRIAKVVRVFGRSWSFYLDVRNLTNHRNVVAVRHDTGSPYAGDPQIEHLAQLAYQAHPEPIPAESPRYRRYADLNDDGLISGSTELMPLYERAARDFLQPLFAYGPPRLFRFGVEVGL